MKAWGSWDRIIIYLPSMAFANIEQKYAGNVNNTHQINRENRFLDVSGMPMNNFPNNIKRILEFFSTRVQTPT